MYRGDITPEHKDFLNEVLEKGMSNISHDHTPHESPPRSLLAYSSAPNLNLLSEVSNMQEKIAALEQRLGVSQLNSSQRFTPKSTRPKVRTRRQIRDNSPASSRSSRQASAERYKSMEQSQRELENLERSLRRTPTTSKNITLYRDMEEMKKLLFEERRRNSNLKKENERLKHKLSYRDDL